MDILKSGFLPTNLKASRKLLSCFNSGLVLNFGLIIGYVSCVDKTIALLYLRLDDI